MRAIVCVLCLAIPAAGAGAEEDAVDFNRDIRRILSDKCFACHGPDDATREADLRFDNEADVFDRDGAVIVRGKPAESELVRRILSDDPDEVMPPPSTNKPLSARDKELLQQWIAEGAKWATHWAYITPQRPQLPAAPPDWAARNPIDQFIHAPLRRAGLQPAPEADRVTLIRRLYFDLIGLPPSPGEVRSFLEDDSPQAFETAVERLLESPHFGERLAIYWLDVVRYADTNGYHSDEPRDIAPYREYVIESFNRNKPYDQFVLEQLAGDLLPEAGLEQRIGSGFNMLLQTTREGGAQPKEYIAKYAADRVRNTSQIFLGSTLGCAECHNHKFDPFTQRDFYSFAAFFADIQQPAVGNPPSFPIIGEQEQQRLAEFDARLAELRTLADTATPELEAAQAKWEAEAAADAAAGLKFGPWWLLGPFRGENFDDVHQKDFIDPAAIDLQAAAGGLKWQQQKYEDGQPHAFDNTPNAARYLYRTITAATASQLAVALGSDDGVTMWVNGKKLHDHKVLRAVAADQDQVTIDLAAGENRIVLKISQAEGGAGFYFRARHRELPEPVVAILKTPAAERTDLQRQELAKYYRSIAPELQPVREQLAQAEAEKKRYLDQLPRTLMTSTGKPQVVRLLNRGNWMDESGPVMEPAIPAFLGTLKVTGRANRLDLAQWIVDPRNPLTARTFVNRLWKLYFGQGLATPLDDLGRQGTLPTHPHLLDWLAVEFVESGWDVKHMIRLLVTSHTYRQSSVVSPELRKADPYNRLYARQSRFRLDAELVRDNALAVSGLLVKDIGGRSVYPYQPAGYWRHLNFPTRTWPGDQGANLYRRGLYTWWQRMFLHPSLQAFDAPSREECTVERPRSNIPQQALVLLNDPTYVEAARAFAGRIVNEGGERFDARLTWAFQQVLSRDPQEREIAALRPLFDQHRQQFESDRQAAEALLSVGASPRPSGAEAAELAAWTSMARILLNLHETITRS